MGASERVRVVLDTGVVVSSLLFEKGTLNWIREGWTKSDLQPLVSRATVEELIRVLSYPKFALERGEIDVVLAAYLPFAEVVRVEGGSVSVLPDCKDPDDQKFLDLAHEGRAEVLVTGDGDLLSLAQEVAFEILSPAQFRRRLVG